MNWNRGPCLLSSFGNLPRPTFEGSAPLSVWVPIGCWLLLVALFIDFSFVWGSESPLNFCFVSFLLGFCLVTTCILFAKVVNEFELL